MITIEKEGNKITIISEENYYSFVTDREDAIQYLEYMIEYAASNIEKEVY